MDLEKLISEVNEVYLTKMDDIVNGLRENGDPEELSYDIEECETFGDLMDLLVEEREYVTIWDTAYVAFIVLNKPYELHNYFGQYK
jgi:hypothetical protein